MRRRRELLQQRAESNTVKDADLVAILKVDAQLAGEFIDKQDLTSNGQTLVPQVIFMAQPHWKSIRGQEQVVEQGQLQAPSVAREASEEQSNNPP